MWPWSLALLRGGADRDPAAVSAMVQDSFGSLPPDQFEMGLDILVRGLAAHLAAG